MSELRQNIVYKEWVIIAKERAKRPHDFIDDSPKLVSDKEYDENCPFCPGNEERFPHIEVDRVGEGSKWFLRSVYNKYPALNINTQFEWSERDIYRTISGYGIHEVIIESPIHNTNPALMTDEEVERIILFYKKRDIEVSRKDNVEYVVIFRNHGYKAGASLVHPHSQLLALPIIPRDVKQRVEEAFKYYSDHGRCVFCKMIEEELKIKERIVMETEYFVSIVLYAASSPFHSWILPKRHVSKFADTTDKEMKDLAKHLKKFLLKLYKGLKNPDYNYIIRTSPVSYGVNKYFHWYITIVPRLTRSAGFELGSGMFINPSIPEEDAKFLREIEV
ncbi:MAG: galactose-1-phosphate uridylyltransferase [Spirochaetia bacterium]|nr:galactose-1-phosphate uridylyltransferase [Spirochaetota bacterium]MCX8097252.1 galactose-1-phosphate uridylyltransferase [Spirochaetota bacterium]MDW8111860.1 galactose-1-phosphate uridylyltransferase [Spirochaetia bacterium]